MAMKKLRAWTMVALCGMLGARMVKMGEMR
jgi:hypothetical protein